MGIEPWELANAVITYCHDFEVYTGKHGQTDWAECSSHHLPRQAPLQLKPYHLHGQHLLLPVMLPGFWFCFVGLILTEHVLPFEPHVGH